MPRAARAEGALAEEIQARAYTPAAMNDGFSWWLVVLGIAVGIGLVWLFTVRLPVSESDIDAEETVEEAGWISETIESWGGVAPAPLVQEVLELHQRYLNGDRSIPGPADEVSPSDGMADARVAGRWWPMWRMRPMWPMRPTGRPAGAAPGDGHSAQLPAAGMIPASYAPPRIRRPGVRGDPSPAVAARRARVALLSVGRGGFDFVGVRRLRGYGNRPGVHRDHPAREAREADVRQTGRAHRIAELFRRGKAIKRFG